MSGTVGAANRAARGARLRGVACWPWGRILGALVAADLVALGLAWRDLERAREVHRLLGATTPEGYAEAVARADPEWRDELLVNLANRYLDQGTRRGWLAGLRAATAYYREALRLNPDLLEAKRNFEVATRRLRASVPPREPRRPMQIEKIRPSQMPLKPTDI